MFSKIDKFIKDELNNLKDILIIKDQNSYTLFGKYKIISHKNLIKVTKGDIGHEFGSIRNAVVWCTLDHAKRFAEAHRLLELDLLIPSRELTIQISKKMIKTSKFESYRLINETKLEEDILKKDRMMYELDRLIQISKSIQTYNFHQLQ